MEKIKDSGMVKKYKNLHEAEKQRHEEAMQRCQEDHMDEAEVIGLHKRCNKTSAKAETKRGAKAKTASKAPRSGCHLFLRDQLEKMTGEDRKNHRSIVSRMWKKIKEDPARLFTNNNRARQMRDKSEKPAKVGDDLSVGSMEQQAVTERPVIKKNKNKNTETAPKSTKVSRVVETESSDSDNNGEEEPVVKKYIN